MFSIQNILPLFETTNKCITDTMMEPVDSQWHSPLTSSYCEVKWGKMMYDRGIIIETINTIVPNDDYFPSRISNGFRRKVLLEIKNIFGDYEYVNLEKYCSISEIEQYFDPFKNFDEKKACEDISKQCKYIEYSDEIIDYENTVDYSTFIFISMMIISIFMCFYTMMDESDYDKYKRKQLEGRRKKAGNKWEITWDKEKKVFVYISNPGFKESGESKCSKIDTFNVSEYPSDEWLRDPENKEKKQRWGITKEERLSITQQAVDEVFKNQHLD